MKGITMFLTGLIVGIVITLILLVLFMPKHMFVVNESRFGFEKTIEAIEKSVKENEWSVPHQYDLQATMKKHGFDVKPVMVFSLCKPEHAYKILSSDDQRLVSALMPCRIAVYEKGGKTYISMLNSGLFSKFMGNQVKTVMEAASKENAQILLPITKNQ